MLRVAILAAVLSCKDDVREVELTREHHTRATFNGVGFAVVFERYCDLTAPLLVMLHARGDTAEHFRDSWHDFPVTLQLALPDTTTEAQLWPALVELAGGRKIMIGGIGDGAEIAKSLATAHADAIACVIPIDGAQVTPQIYGDVVTRVRECIQKPPSNARR